MITKNEFTELSKVHSEFCISIFIPTHRAGEETLKGKDIIVLKNQLKSVKNELELQGMSEAEVKDFLKPADDLLEDPEFRKNMSDGLAIFISEELFRKYTLPLNFEEFSYVSNEFYLKPLVPVFNDDGLFYLLTLKADEVKFFEGSRDSITKIRIDDLVPSRKEDRVGYDHEQKNLQFRTQQGGKGEGIFHGQSDNESESKEELSRFFRSVNKGLLTILHDNQKPPLLLCCLDYYFPMYKEVNTYQNLYPEHISGNPSDMDDLLLHERAWELVKRYFNQNRKIKSDLFLQGYNSGKSSSELKEIIPAALSGKVDTLFLENRSDIFGIYNTSTLDLRLDPGHKIPNISLMNFLAVKVFEQGGSVYLMEKENMPDDSSKVNAFFRY
ncbi:MAG TPA: hypothetical protein PKC58_00005 [Ignavibacteria bacterium]|mgnify:CR=1 FL=1|nr:hypothetical protein [Ignavibacteria bacterium]